MVASSTQSSWPLGILKVHTTQVALIEAQQPCDVAWHSPSLVNLSILGKSDTPILAKVSQALLFSM